jgi:hypothetical protein
MIMKKTIVLSLTLLALISFKSNAQVIDLENLDVSSLFGKVLQVKRGWAPQFFSGKKKIPKLNIVGQVLGSKNNNDINRLFNTFKTGRTIYKIGAYAGSAVTLYGTIKNIINNGKDSITAAAKSGAKTALYSGLGSMATSVIIKLLTKAASYKAVDMFGGLIKRKLEDIISLDMGASNNFGRPGFKAGLIIHL